jgi:hypothetical protein
MIREFEFYHGVVFSKLVHHFSEGVSVKTYPSTSNASYILNDNIGLYVKHSAKRITPWRFSFQKIHQDEIAQMKAELGNVFVILVCGDDGVVTLSFDELKIILNEIHEEIEWISASRSANKEYSIKGSDGVLNKKVGKNDFPKKLLKLSVTKMEQSIAQL